MLYLLRSGFSRDLIVHFLVVVLVGSAIAMAAGYMADNYFGNTVTGLIGDYGEYDLLLTVNRETRRSALAQIRDILRVKLPGSKVEQGVTIAGKTNFFVSLDDKYKTREYFMKMSSYFSNVTGLVGVTMMSEPRVTIRGVPRGLLEEFEQKLADIKGVHFTYPVGSSGIDLMLNSPKDIDYVTEEVKKFLKQYQVLEVRFPIDNGPVDVISMGEKLATELKDKYNLAFAKNLTTNEVDDQQYLVNTMLEMKKFLLQYATVITIPVSPDWDFVIHKDDYLIMPGPGRSGLKVGEDATPMDLKLQVTEVNDKEIQALIVEGNVTDIQSKGVYKLDAKGKIAAFLGEARIKSPREDLKYAADELAKVLPHLDQIFSKLYGMTGEALKALEIYNDTLAEIKEVQKILKEGQAKVEEIRNKLNQLDLSKVQNFIGQLLAIVNTAEEFASKMEWAQKEIVRIDYELGQFQGQVEILKNDFGLSESYSKELDQAVDVASKLQLALRNNTGEILKRLNEYNPILRQISDWRSDLEKLEQMVISGDLLNNNTSSVTDILDRLISGSKTTLEYLDRLDDKKMSQEIQGFKESLEKIQESDVEAIIKELNYISDTLPNLRDEEVTRAIKLIEKYMSGQIIPGEQILILVPADLNIKSIEPFVMEVVGQSTISVFSMDAGIVQPNVRGEFLRIISEVRETITAMVAVVLIMLVLMLDLSGIMSVIKELRKRKKQAFIVRIINSEVLFGMIMGSLTLELIFRLTNGQLPYIENHPGAWIGAIMGLVIALMTDRINPVDKKEYIAGEALGFNLTEILRQIVIPAGKPGILYLLNRRNLIFK
ncbi:hypothetical protein BBF96_11460 [Anoxybacter fermentans]|uniref:Uncharacterized protein n=1 Tax=Anoxybacter fermentans TaxID=1323375 RepID=A0A3Q9HR80_9FIRM|nr:hypothetical protein [Anoxybacter fermentans]AZR73953.1 hypothetical protein BBF96_11460 [Anoxybacter fermentans]